MKCFKEALSAVIFTLLCLSCKKFVNINPPVTQLVTADVFTNSAAIISAEMGIYTQMCTNNESLNMSLDNGLLADEFTNYSASTTQLAYYQDGMSPTIGSFGCWSHAYGYIYQANAILAGMQGNKLNATISNQIVGEAKFIRAFWNFYLTNEYGDVPLVSSTNYTVNSGIARTAQAEVYRQIVTDLTEAENLLSSNYLDATDTVVTTERVRPNQAVAAALLARVYLYMGKYDSAEMQATQVINNPLYKLIMPLTTTNYAFTKNNTEAIWQLSTPLPASLSGATFDGFEYILTSAPSSVALSSTLVNSFEAGDQRKAIWVGTYTTTTTPHVTYSFPYKYKVNLINGSATNITEYVMVLRLAEQYLIRAEAEAELGDMANATIDLNTIRARAGLGPSSTLTSSSTLKQADSAILHERQVELFAEWGHRWFDLIRTGSVDSVMGNPVNVCQSKKGTWNDNSKLYPIWPSDLIADPSLTQNAGY